MPLLQGCLIGENDPLHQEESDEEFGQRLRAYRKKLAWSQEHFASLLGLTRGAYSHYETGRRSPDRQMIIRIANRINISLDELLKGVEEVEAGDDPVDDRRRVTRIGQGNSGLLSR